MVGLVAFPRLSNPTNGKVGMRGSAGAFFPFSTFRNATWVPMKSGHPED